MNREGFYKIEYRGGSGAGVGMIVLDTGEVVGADIAGGSYLGSYAFNVQTNMIDVDAIVEIAPGAWAVTGHAAGSTPLRFPLQASIPKGQIAGYPISAQTPLGPIQFRLTWLRGFPT